MEIHRRQGLAQCSRGWLALESTPSLKRRISRNDAKLARVRVNMAELAIQSFACSGSKSQDLSQWRQAREGSEQMNQTAIQSFACSAPCREYFLDPRQNAQSMRLFAFFVAALNNFKEADAKGTHSRRRSLDGREWRRGPRRFV